MSAKAPKTAGKAKAAPPPKDMTGKKGEKTPEQLQVEEDAKVLKRKARALGVISHRSAGEDKEHCELSRLKISPGIRKHSSAKPVEILKKSTGRKNRVLFLFPGLVSVVQEGKFGQLYDMDKNPKLDIEFRGGRLRLVGTHVHTKSKLVTLVPAKGGKRMQALDFFEHAVVFSQHEWLGDKDSDPTKDIPETAFKVQHKDVSFTGGAASTSQSSARTPSIKDYLVSEGGQGQQAGASEPTPGRTKRAAASKAKYRDGSDSSAADDDGDSDEDEKNGPSGTRSPVRLPVATEALTAAILAGSAKKRPKAAASAGSAGKAKRKHSSDESEAEMSDDDDEVVEVKAERTNTPRRATASKPKSYVIKDSDDDNDDAEEADSEDDHPKPKAPPRKAAGSPGKKAKGGKRKKQEDSDDDQQDSDESASESEDAKPVKKKPAKRAPPKKPAAKKRKQGSDSEESDASDESLGADDDDSDFEP